MEGRTDGRTDGWMDGVDGWIAGRTNGWIVRRCYTELVTPANNRVFRCTREQHFTNEPLVCLTMHMKSYRHTI